MSSPGRRRCDARWTSLSLVVVLPCVAGAIAFAGARSVAADEPSVSTTWARSTFLADCAVCHGNRGQGSETGPSLHGVGSAAVDYWVSTGRMPLSIHHHGPRIDRHRPRYSPAEIAALVDYVTNLTGGGLPIPQVSTRGNAAAGGVVYRINCAACHSWAGTGGALEDREAPNLFSATPTQIAEAVRVGPDAMPAFGEAAISKRQLDDVVAYVHDLDHPDDRGGLPLWHAGPLAEGAVAIVLGLGALLVVLRLIGTRT